MSADPEAMVASLAGRTIVSATLSEESHSEWTGCDVLTLVLDDQRELTITSHGWHDISGLVLEASERPWPWPDRHGWVVPLEPPAHAKCGGPAICRACAAERAEAERRA